MLGKISIQETTLTITSNHKLIIFCYIQSQTTWKLFLFQGDLPITEMLIAKYHTNRIHYLASLKVVINTKPVIHDVVKKTRHVLLALGFKTFHLLVRNVWNREHILIQCRILQKMRNKKRSIKKKIYLRYNLNNYIQS